MINAAAALSMLGGAASGGSTTSAVVAFAKYKRDPEGARRDFYESAAVQKNIKNFQSRISKINSLEDFLSDRKTLSFVLTSFGLEAELNNPGKLKAIINSDPNDLNSYANRLSDSRYGNLNKFLNVKFEGFTKLQNSAAQTKIIDNYLTNAFEVSIGRENPAAREAVFFLRRINEVNSSLEILGDMPLRRIVTSVLNLPPQIARQSVLKQQSLLDAKLDFDKLNSLNRDTGKASKSRLNLINEDLSAIKTGLTTVTNASTELSRLQDKLGGLRTRLQDIGKVTDPGGKLADEIPVQKAAIPELIRQQGLIASAEKALATTDTKISRIEAIFAEAAGVEIEDELDALKDELALLVTEITGADGTIKGSNYTDSSAVTTENLLLPAGDSVSGIAALPSKNITTKIKSDDSAVLTYSYDLSGFLTKLDSANAAFQAIDFGDLSSDIAAAKVDFDAADSDFNSATFWNGLNASNFSGSMGGVTFGYSLNTLSLSQGISAVDDGLSRLAKAASVISEIRTLARDATRNGADIAELDKAYADKLDSLKSLINTAGTATDGSNTVTLDNLLVGGTISYEADADSGKKIDARGGSLDTDILDALPTNLSAANANNILSDIDTTVTEALSELKDNLVTDRKVFDFAVNVADPLGSIDGEIRQFRSDLDDIIERAGESGDNLLSEFGSDLKVVLETLGTTITVDNQGGFKKNFESPLNALHYISVSSGLAGARESVLNDALFSVGSTLSRLKAEKFTLDIQNSILSEKQSLLTNTGGSAENLSFLKPLENTKYALKLIEQYVVKKDLEAIGGSTSAQPNNAAMVGLFQNIGGGGGLLNQLS